MNGFYFARQQRRLHAGARRALNDCRDSNEIGAFHIVGLTGLLIEIRVSCDAVFFRPCAATNGRVVGIRHGWKDRIHSFEQALLPHRAQRRQGTRFEVIHAESIDHADNDPLFSNEGHSYKVSTISLLHPVASRRTAVSLQRATNRRLVCYTENDHSNRRYQRISAAHRRRARP